VVEGVGGHGRLDGGHFDGGQQRGTGGGGGAGGHISKGGRWRVTRGWRAVKTAVNSVAQVGFGGGGGVEGHITKGGGGGSPGGWGAVNQVGQQRLRWRGQQGWVWNSW
jgi:hypothetical protein